LVAVCETAEQALATLKRANPDVISMDIHLPGMSGLEATRRIMETRPTPIVIVSKSINAEEGDATMEALRAGAVSVVEKPSSQRRSDFAEKSARICRELVVMSQVKVIRQRFNCLAPRPARLPQAQPPAAPLLGGVHKPARMVGIVASTGGPRALETVLAGLGSDFPLPVVLVQHITASFHSSFVSWLNRISPQPVKEACHGEIAMSGHVYVAPADQHVYIRGDRLRLAQSPPIGGQRPSGTVLLQSMADTLGQQAIGVLLTGMGDDGAEGLLAIRRAGGYTIAEDKSTAVVDGMPAVARQIGAACVSLPLEAIGPTVSSIARTRVEVRT
jgi:two-component system chemotaxis response regulator CheB